MHYDLIQIGSHIGDTKSDYIFNNFDETKKAIFIEPIKEYFDKLKNNYSKKYPNNLFEFLNVACSNEVKKITLYKPIIKEGLPDWADQLTSVLPDHTKNHNLNTGVIEVEVDAITINYLVEKNNITSIELLSVDTEGHDFEILINYDFSKVKPNKITFEHKHMDGTNKTYGVKYNILMNMLTSHGYRIIKQTIDDTYLILTF